MVTPVGVGPSFTIPSPLACCFDQPIHLSRSDIPLLCKLSSVSGGSVRFSVVGDVSLMAELVFYYRDRRPSNGSPLARRRLTSPALTMWMPPRLGGYWVIALSLAT